MLPQRYNRLPSAPYGPVTELHHAKVQIINMYVHLTGGPPFGVK